MSKRFRASAAIAATDSLPPSCLRILAVVCQAGERGEVLTVREVNRRAGRTGYCQDELRRLKDAGLIAFEPGKCRTIRPTCRMELFQEEVRK